MGVDIAPRKMVAGAWQFEGIEMVDVAVDIQGGWDLALASVAHPTHVTGLGNHMPPGAFDSRRNPRYLAEPTTVMSASVTFTNARPIWVNST